MIKRSDYEFLAREFYLDVGEIKLIELDHPLAAFLPDGRCTISFDSQRFHEFTGQFLDSVDDYHNQTEAVKIDERLAYECTRWGKYEIPGYEYKSYGCDCIEDLVHSVNTSEFDQLMLYIIHLDYLNNY